MGEGDGGTHIGVSVKAEMGRGESQTNWASRQARARYTEDVWTRG